MALRKLVMVAALAASAVGGLPSAAQAHEGHGHRHYRHHYDHHRTYNREGHAEPRRYYARESCRSSGTTGLILGGAAGALLGREIDKSGDRAPGTIIGAGAGALVGRELDRKHRC